MAVKKKAKEKGEVVVPEAVNKPVEEKFEVEPAQYLDGKNLYTVRLDTKKLERRTMEQAQALLFGADGVAKKITIELE